MKVLNISGEKSKKSAMIKNALIVALVIVVIGLSVKVHLSNNSGYDEGAVPEDGDVRPIPPGGGSGSTSKENICLTQECITTAANLYKQMNLKADPCEDFNEFACGKFMKEFTLPEDKSRWTSFTPIGEVIYGRAKVILEEPNKESEWRSERMTKDLYREEGDEMPLLHFHLLFSSAWVGSARQSNNMWECYGRRMKFMFGTIP